MMNADYSFLLIYVSFQAKKEKKKKSSFGDLHTKVVTFFLFPQSVKKKKKSIKNCAAHG